MSGHAAQAEPAERQAEFGIPEVVWALRAAAVTLVVLGQAWLVFPLADYDRWRPLTGLLRSGGIGINVLLACSAFVLASQVMSLENAEFRAAGKLVLKHLGRLLGAVLLALLFVWVVVAVQGPSPHSAEVTRTSFEQVVGFNWNHYVADHPLGVRSDLVGLWYFSVEAQTMPLVAALVLVFRRRPEVLAVVVAAAVALVHANQAVLAQTHSWFEMSLWTITRADGVLWGLLAALSVRIVRQRARSPQRLGEWADQLVGSVVVLYIGLIVAQAYLGPMTAFQGVYALTGGITALVLAGSSLAAGRASTFRSLQVDLLQDLGRLWAVVLALAGPYIHTLVRNTSSWSNWSRAMLGLAMFVMLLYVLDRVVIPFARSGSRHLLSARR